MHRLDRTRHYIEVSQIQFLKLPSFRKAETRHLPFLLLFLPIEDVLRCRWKA